MKEFRTEANRLGIYILNEQKLIKNRAFLAIAGFLALAGIGFGFGNPELPVVIILLVASGFILGLLAFIYYSKPSVLTNLYGNFKIEIDETHIHLYLYGGTKEIEIAKIAAIYKVGQDIVIRSGNRKYQFPDILENNEQFVQQIQEFIRENRSS